MATAKLTRSPSSVTPIEDNEAWRFTMLATTWTRRVLRHLRALPPRDRPNLCLQVFLLCVTSLRRGACEVTLSAEDLAAELKQPNRSVKAAMNVMAQAGIIHVELRAGRTCYSVNPHVAWNGAIANRAEIAAAIPPPNIPTGKHGSGA